MKTSQDLFKQLDEAESLFTKGSIKVAQKKLEKLLQSLKNWTRYQTNLGINLILQLVNQDILMICRLLQLIQKEKN